MDKLIQEAEEWMERWIQEGISDRAWCVIADLTAEAKQLQARVTELEEYYRDYEQAKFHHDKDAEQIIKLQADSRQLAEAVIRDHNESRWCHFSQNSESREEFCKVAPDDECATCDYRHCQCPACATARRVLEGK